MTGIGRVCAGMRRRKRMPWRALASFASLVLLAQIGVPAFAASAVPLLSFSHVVLVLEENHSYSEVVGDTAAMPYLNSLIRKYGSATRYFADTHPSLPNYMILIAGSSAGITSDGCSFTANEDNAVREMTAAGVSWNAYEEGLPYAGYLGCSWGEYVKRHDPFAYLSDVEQSQALQRHIVPFAEFRTDLARGKLPRFSFVTPNLLHDAHDGSLAQADAWLKDQMAPLLASKMFQPGGKGLLIITFDEGTDDTNGGGRVPWVVVGPTVRSGYRSSTFYRHESTLRLIMEDLGVRGIPGLAATAPDMTEFFRPQRSRVATSDRQ